MMRTPAAVVLVSYLCWAAATVATGQQRSPEARRIAVEWLTSPTVAGAVKHLPPSAVAQVRAFQKAATGEQQQVGAMIDMILAPLAALRERGGATVATKGQPVDVVTMTDGPGDGPTEYTIGDEQLNGDVARVPVTIRAAGRLPESGFIDVRRDGRAWRVVAASLGPDMHFPSYETPNFVQAAAGFLVASLGAERVRTMRAMAVGDLRAMISAQLSLSVVNGGFFAPPECLVAPASCKVPSSEPLLGERSLETRGFAGTFHPGPKPSAAEIRRNKAIQQSLSSWAYVLTPEDAALKLPVLCADSTARICALTPGARITGGVCPAACEEIK